MRLVNIRTLHLEEFEEGSIPPYAALSHRWTSGELNFKEVYKKRTDIDKLGYKKLVAACQKAADYHVEYLWIDTCCINKESSAELSEAINSMFSWYESSKVCLAYLQDVRAGAEFDSTFRGSVWFRRAWTLQELIAPQSVEFFDCSWTYIGSKISNARLIEGITGIFSSVLEKDCPLSVCSIAKKMSWAAERVATRREDIAYSLLGIFGINMPPLYGEGSKAFLRLQREIMQHTNDTTFLLWGQHNVLDDQNPRLLAHSPAEFVEAKYRGIFSFNSDNPMTVTNIGIKIRASVVRWKPHIYGIFIAWGEVASMFVLLVRKYPQSNAFYRIGVAKLPGFKDRTLTEGRKLLVLWGREGQLNKRRLDNAINCLNHGFVIETDKPFLIGPVNIAGPYQRIVDEDQRIADEVQRRVTVVFGNPMDRTKATFWCQIGENSTVSIQLTFDLDSNPIARVYNDNACFDARQAFDSTPHSSVTGGGLKESEMTITTCSRTGRVSGSLQSREPDMNTFARIPKVFVTNDRALWISFINPQSYFNNSPGWWKFCISPLQPQIGPY